MRKPMLGWEVGDRKPSVSYGQCIITHGNVMGRTIGSQSVRNELDGDHQRIAGNLGDGREKAPRRGVARTNIHRAPDQ